MSEPGKVQIRTAAIFGFLAVALGAFGAHALEAHLEETGKADVWSTAVLYHLVHAAVLLALALGDANKNAFRCIAAGIVVFSGSLYVLALSGIGVLGAITPIGGVLMLAGWLLLAINGRGS